MRSQTLGLILATLLPQSTLADGLSSDTATYKVRFETTWSRTTHPHPSFPANPHFSGLIGGVHNADATLWQADDLASPGIEAMAEMGKKTPLDSEVAALIASGDALRVINGRGIPLSPGSVATTFGVHRDFPLVSLVSMLAPSPDWFVGVSGLSLFEDGDWLEQKVAVLYPWDAGTDSGTVYRSNDADTQPPEPIQPLTVGPFAGNPAPIGTFTFTRQDASDPEPLMLGNGRFKITAEWQNFELTRGLAKPVALSDDTGYFWFFSEGNVETVIKVIDGCSFNERFWVFAGGLTSVEVEITVEDTESGQVNIYANPLGAPFQPIQDTDAFAVCP